jgi:predicted PurR-regulated permease PerM
MDSKAINRWFFVLAILPMLVLTAPFFIPVFMGAALACVSMQVRDLGIHHLKIRRSWAHVLVPTLLVFTLLLVLVFVVLTLSSAVSYLRTDFELKDVSGVIAKIKNSALVFRVKSVLQSFGVNSFAQLSGDFSKDVLANITDPLKSIFGQLPALTVGLFIFVLSFLGIYLNEKEVVRFFLSQKIIPERYSRILLHSFSEYSYSAFAAAGFTALAQGATIGIGAAASGAPSAFVFGVIGALSSLLPYVGTFPVSILIGLLLYSSDASTSQYVILLCFAVTAGLIDNVLRPIIVKSRSDLHPWVAFISIFGGLVFWGLAGVFIGPVLAGMSLDLSKELIKEA